MSLPQAITDTGEYDFTVLNRELDKAKTKIFLGSNSAFLGSLMSCLNFVWSKEIETAGTDGETFWWNPQDFIDLPPLERSATCEHELWHVARMHNDRRGTRDPRIWNIACDIRINRDLRLQGYVLPPPMWIQDMPECPYEAEEDIYNWLQQNQMKLPQLPNGSYPGNGHMQPNPAAKGTAIANVVQAMHQAKIAKQAGNLPGGVEETINKFLNPILPWNVLLHKFFTDFMSEDFSLRTPNRRHLWNDMYLPSRVKDNDRLAHLVWYFDVSGSVTDEQERRVSSEIKYIKDKFNPQKLTIVQFDTQITKIEEITEDDQFNEIRIVGRGGTDLEPVRQHMLDTKPTAAIIFSDLFVTPMRSLPIDIPTIWICLSNPTATVNFGKLVHIND